MSTWCSKKICKVAFNDIYNKQRIFQDPVIDFNLELLVKIVKQKTVFAKGSILDVSQVLSLPWTTFFDVFLLFLRTTETNIDCKPDLIIQSDAAKTGDWGPSARD